MIKSLLASGQTVAKPEVIRVLQLVHCVNYHCVFLLWLTDCFYFNLFLIIVNDLLKKANLN